MCITVTMYLSICSNFRVVRPISHKLTPEEELTVVEWIRANPCIYDKGDPEHKDREKRARLFQEKAEELGELQARDIQGWYVGEYGPQRCWGHALD